MTIKSEFVDNPNIKKLVKELEDLLVAITKDPLDIEKKFNAGKQNKLLNAQQLEDLIKFGLEVIAPDDPTKDNIQNKLSQMSMHSEIRIAKKNRYITSSSNVTTLGSPHRTVAFLKNRNGDFEYCVMTLSKQADNKKTPLYDRVESKGSTKSLKTVHLLNTLMRSDYVKNDMARLHISFTSLDELKSLKYEIMLTETIVGIGSEHIAKPRLGSPYRNKINNTFSVNIYDAKAMSLLSFINNENDFYNYPARYNHNATVKFTETERRQISDNQFDPALPAPICNIVQQLLSAVEIAHKFNIVHGDIKLDNVLIDRNKNGELIVKLTDFGTAINLDQLKSHTSTLMKLLGYTNEILLNGKILYYLSVDATIKYIISSKWYKNIIQQELLDGNSGVKSIAPIIFEKTRLMIQNIPIGYNNLDSIIKDPPTLESLNLRIEYIMKEIECDYTVELLESLPATSADYAAPEVFATNISKSTYLAGYYKDYINLCIRNNMIVPSGYQLANRVSKNKTTIFDAHPDPKQDIFSLGILIFYLKYNSLPNAEDNSNVNAIYRSNFLRGMLAVMPEKRFTIYQAIEQFKIETSEDSASYSSIENTNENLSSASASVPYKILQSTDNKLMNTNTRAEKRCKLSNAN